MRCKTTSIAAPNKHSFYIFDHTLIFEVTLTKAGAMRRYTTIVLKREITLSLIFLIGFFTNAFGQDADNMLRDLAQQVAEKRSEVESLSNELELMKTDYNERMRSIAAQRADIETQINREELRLAKIQRDLEEYRATIDSSRTSIEGIEPLVSEVLGKMRDYIESALPFQVPGRLGEIETLERLLVDGSLEADKILARTWNFLDSEFRLTRESGIYHQTIFLDGQLQLAEVARLGMVFLYFKTLSDKYGFVVHSPDGWRYTRSRSREEDRQIAFLFDSLRKNLREGFFTIPNPEGDR